LASFSRAEFETLRIVTRVHENARQRVRIQFDMPGAIRPFAHGYVRYHGLNGFQSEFESGLGRERANFGDHVGDVLGIYAANRAQSRHIASRHKLEIGDQRLHGGIETVLLAQLQSETFREIARADTGWAEPLHYDEKASQRIVAAAPRRSRKLVEIDAQISRFVDRIDDTQRAISRLSGPSARDRELIQQMILERLAARQSALERILVHFHGRAGAKRCSSRLRCWKNPIGIFGIDDRTRSASMSSALVKSSRASAPSRGSGFAGSAARLLALFRPAGIRFRRARAADSARAPARHSRQFDVGQLQQLDRLLQLRRHDERLALPISSRCVSAMIRVPLRQSEKRSPR
jgi:hypothetical protein